MRVDLSKGHIISQVNAVQLQHFYDLIKRDSPTTINISLLEDIHRLILSDGWVDSPQKLKVLLKR